MNNRFERIAVEAVTSFIVISAVAGGVGLISGGLPFPMDWLENTPFRSYFLPGMILGLIVGGSALVATVLMLRRHPLAAPVAVCAGFIQVGWIIGVVLLVGTRDNLMAWLQMIYFAAGAIVATLATDAWLRSRRRVLPGV